jgi:hypothetical protein
VHIEGDGGMWSIDTDTDLFDEEANLVTVLGSQWGGSSGRYGTDAFNSQGIVPITVGGKTYDIFGEGDAYGPPTTRPYEQTDVGHIEAVSGFWVRSITSPASPTSPSYTVFPGDDAAKPAILNAIHPTTLVPPRGTALADRGLDLHGTRSVSAHDFDEGRTARLSVRRGHQRRCWASCLLRRV